MEHFILIYKKLTPTTLIVISLLLFALASCSSGNQIHEPMSLENYNTSDWVYAQLRIIDAVEMKNPSSDIIAIYTREMAGQLEIRIDFLVLDKKSQNDIRIAIDYTNGGSNAVTETIQSDIAWEILYSSKSNNISFFDHAASQNQSDNPEVVYDEQMEAVLITFPEWLLSNLDRSRLNLQVFCIEEDTPDNSSWDHTSTFMFDTHPPKRRAPLLLTFWDSFNAYTPAQALRLWNGAHTGVIGQRHGLFHILTAVETHQVPVILLDIKKPTSLAALSYMEQLNWIRALEQKGLIILPDTGYGDPSANSISLSYSSKSAQLYDLKNSPYAFGAFRDMNLTDKYDTTFAFISNSNHIYSKSEKESSLYPCLITSHRTIYPQNFNILY